MLLAALFAKGTALSEGALQCSKHRKPALLLFLARDSTFVRFVVVGAVLIVLSSGAATGEHNTCPA
jgi:hypothetical protein